MHAKLGAISGCSKEYGCLHLGESVSDEWF